MTGGQVVWCSGTPRLKYLALARIVAFRYLCNRAASWLHKGEPSVHQPLKQMTVGELQARLAEFPPDSPVWVATEQNHPQCPSYRAVGSTDTIRHLSGGGRETGRSVILRFLERVPTHQPPERRKPIRLRYDLPGNAEPTPSEVTGTQDETLSVLEFHIGDRVYHGRADMFGSIRAVGKPPGKPGFAMVQYEWPWQGPEKEVPIAELSFR